MFGGFYFNLKKDINGQSLGVSTIVYPPFWISGFFTNVTNLQNCFEKNQNQDF